MKDIKELRKALGIAEEGMADTRENRFALIDAAGGNAVLKNAPSYLQLLVRRELGDEEMERLKNMGALGEALARKPMETIIKVRKKKLTKIPEEWRDELIEIFG